MSGAGVLLDVNVLIAMAWPAHHAHSKVHQWLARHAHAGWATCPFTQAGFVRIVSNPAFSPHALTPANAFVLLKANLAHPAHRFWPNDIGLEEATTRFESRILGHQQITDAYLLGLAVHKRGKLATLDSRVVSLLPETGPLREIVIVI